MKKYIQYVKEDIWRLRLRDLSKAHLLGIHILRMLFIALRGFINDQCGLRASALTLYTLLSIVPVLAMAFGFAKGFNMEELLEKEIYNFFRTQNAMTNNALEANSDASTSPTLESDLSSTEVLQVDSVSAETELVLSEDDEFSSSSIALADENSSATLDTASTETLAQFERAAPEDNVIAKNLIEFSQTMLDNTSGGLIAGIGVLILIFTVMKALGNIEDAFNHIWGIGKPRLLWRKFTDYFFVLLISMLSFIMSSSMTVVIQSLLNSTNLENQFLILIVNSFSWLLKLMPLVLMFGLFSFLYVFIPNTKVSVSAGMVGGIIAAILYQSVQVAYINLQFLTANYGAIYGSFAAMPLFMVWLHMSWMIVLLGAEFAFAFQNAELFDYESDCLNVSLKFKRKVMLRVSQICISRFQEGQKPLSGEEIAHEIAAPIRLTNTVLYELVQAGVLSEVNPNEQKATLYQPARAVENLTIASVIDAWESLGSEDIPLADSDSWNVIKSKVEIFQKDQINSAENKLLKDI